MDVRWVGVLVDVSLCSSLPLYLSISPSVCLYATRSVPVSESNCAWLACPVEQMGVRTASRSKARMT